MSKEDGPKGMQKRRITLHDGRYLIFYTFEDEPVPDASDDQESAARRRREPKDAVPQAEEERRV
ncbi:MAG TPA: hypothetical protein VM911_09900 [Pyrinomonadaceae bacterium]|jgi:hypothetical protein|nr:hypothetical protein [Pyrinomonadaceae bacterium]